MVQQNVANQPLNLHMDVGTTVIDGSYFAAEPTHDFHPKSSFHWQTLVNWTINLAEIAAIVGAEIFSAGTATPAIVGIIAGLTATAATTAIDATEGTISYVNLGIGVATSFIPMGSLMRQEFKAVTALENNTEQLAKFIKGVRAGVYQADNDKFLINIAESLDTAVEKGTISQSKADKAWKIIRKLQNDPRLRNDEVTLARLVATRFISKRALTEELKDLGGLTRKVTTAEVKSLGARGTRVLREVTRQQLMNEAEGDLAKGLARITHMENLMEMVVSGEFRGSYREGLRFFERGPEYVKNAIRRIFPEVTETELNSYIRPGYFKKLNAAMVTRNEARLQLDKIEEYLTTQYPDTWQLEAYAELTAGEYAEMEETEIMPEIIRKKRGRGTINPDGTKVFTPDVQLNVGDTFGGANNVPQRILSVGKDPNALWDVQFDLTEEQKALSMLYGHPVLMIRQLKQAAGYVPEDTWETMMTYFLTSLDEIDKMAIDKLLKSTGKYSIDNLSQVFFRAASLDQQISGTSVVKYMGSHTFNKGPKELKWRDVKNWKQFRQKAFTVQHFQLIDPNDAGRAIPEGLYQAAQEKIADKIKFNKQFKEGRKRIKTPGKILKAFEKSGGRLWPQQGPRRYIIGHKVIKQPSVAGEPYLVLIIFDKINTAPKTTKKRENVLKAAKRHQAMGNLDTAATLFKEANSMSMSFKNIGGKKDIMILANEKDLLGFEAEGTAYWFRHGKGRGWYASRGGRRASKFGSIQLGSTLSLFLGFAPIGAIKNVGSIVTNWVENTNDMIRGRYGEQWTKKFVASFENTLYKRSGRLASRVVLGGLVKRGLADKTGLAAFVGNNAPRELQRFTSIFLTNLGGKDSSGHFRFQAKGASTWERGIMMGAVASGRSAEMRKARSQAHIRGLTSYATELNSTSRKLQVVRRTPGTLTPNTMFNPRSFGRIKIK